MLDPDATVAEVTRGSIEEMPRGGIVEVDVEAIGEEEFDLAEWIVRAGIFPERVFGVLREDRCEVHFLGVYLVGIVGLPVVDVHVVLRQIARVLAHRISKLLDSDARGNVPARIEHHVGQRVAEHRRAAVFLPDDDAHRHDAPPSLPKLHLKVGDVHKDVA